MNPLHVAAASLFCVAASLPAQSLFEHCANLDRTDVSGFLRDTNDADVPVSVGYNAVYSAADFAGWGYSVGDGGMSEVRVDGVRVLLGSLDTGLASEVDIFVYPESTVSPGAPDVSSPAAAFTYSVFGSGTAGTSGAARFNLPFPSPAILPAGRDVFIEVFLDGQRAPDLLFGVLGGVESGADPVFDIGNSRTSETGHGNGGAGGYLLVLFTDTTPPRAEAFQGHVSPLVQDQAGLAMGVTTQQASLPGSMPPFLSASLFSGLHPSAQTDRLGNTREDNTGLLVNGPFTTGDPITVLMTPLGFGATPVTLSDFFAGAIGSICLNLAGPLAEIGPTTSNATGFARVVLTIPAPARPAIQGFDFAFQAIGISVLDNSINATGCINQQW